MELINLCHSVVIESRWRFLFSSIYINATLLVYITTPDHVFCNHRVLVMSTRILLNNVCTMCCFSIATLVPTVCLTLDDTDYRKLLKTMPDLAGPFVDLLRDRIDFELAKIPLFAAMSDYERNQLSTLFEYREVAAGEMVFDSLDSSTGKVGDFYVIQSGSFTHEEINELGENLVEIRHLIQQTEI